MVVLRGRGCAGSGVRKFRNRIAVLHRLEVFRFVSFGSGWFLHGRRSCANAGSTVVRAAMRDICFMIMTRKISVTLTSGKQICQFSGFLLPSLRLFGRLRPYAGTPGGTVRRHSPCLRSDTCRPGRVHRAGYARHRCRRTVHVPRQRGGRGLLRSGRRRRISHAAGPCSGRSRGRRLRSVRVRTAESSCASRRCLRGAVPSRFPASRAEPGKNRTVWSSPVSADPDTGTIRFQIAIVRFLRNSTRRTGERRNYFFVERRNLRFFPV